MNLWLTRILARLARIDPQPASSPARIGFNPDRTKSPGLVMKLATARISSVSSVTDKRPVQY